MSRLEDVIGVLKDVVCEPLAKVISYYTSILKRVMDVFSSISSFFSRYYFPRTMAPVTGVVAPIEKMGGELSQAFPSVSVQPKVSYAINVFRRLSSMRPAFPQPSLRRAEAGESLVEAYNVVGEALAHVAEAGGKVSRFRLEERLEEVSGEAGKASPAREEGVEAFQAELGRGLIEPFTYIGGLVKALAQVYRQVSGKGYPVTVEGVLEEAFYSGQILGRPAFQVMEVWRGLGEAGYMLKQPALREAFTLFEAPAGMEPASVGFGEIYQLQSMPQIISLAVAKILMEAYGLGLTPLQAPYAGGVVHPSLGGFAREGGLMYAGMGVELSILHESLLEKLKALSTSALASAAEGWRPYGVIPLTAFYERITYHGMGYAAKALQAPYIAQVMQEYALIGRVLRLEAFQGKAVYSKLLSLMETLPSAQGVFAVQYGATELVYTLSPVSRYFMQSLVQLYDKLLYEVKVVRPSEASPMVTAASEFLQTAKIFSAAEEEARREVERTTLQPYTIGRARPSQTMLEREVQNVFNITVPEGAELDIWELERKITQILREQFRRYYGPTF